MNDTSGNPSPRRRFVYGLLAPIAVGVFAMLILGDVFAIGAYSGLALAAVAGIYAGIFRRKWAFLLGFVTSLVALVLLYVFVWRLNHH